MDQVPLIVNRLVGLLLLCFLVQTGFAQSRRDSVHVTFDANDTTFINTVAEPEYPGGSKALAAYLKRTVQYPETAARANVKGSVFASFVIDSTGRIHDVAILKSLGYGCDEEAVRVIRAMSCWKPGTQLGKPVAVKYQLQIRFPLP